MKTEVVIHRPPQTSTGWSAYLLTVLLLNSVTIWTLIYRPWIVKPFIHLDEWAYQISCIGYLAALFGAPLVFIAGRLKFLNEKQNLIPPRTLEHRRRPAPRTGSLDTPSRNVPGGLHQQSRLINR